MFPDSAAKNQPEDQDTNFHRKTDDATARCREEERADGNNAQID